MICGNINPSHHFACQICLSNCINNVLRWRRDFWHLICNSTSGCLGLNKISPFSRIVKFDLSILVHAWQFINLRGKKKGGGLSFLDANLCLLDVKRHYLVYENYYYTIMTATQNYPMHVYVALHFPCRECYEKRPQEKKGVKPKRSNCTIYSVYTNWYYVCNDLMNFDRWSSL